MSKTIKVEDFEKAVTDIVEEYFDGVATDAEKCVATVAAETTQELQESSPKDKGRYFKSWKIKQGKKSKKYNEVEIYNTRYQLTHLLEHGHLKVVHGKVLGFTDAVPHIADAEKHAIRKLTEGIERSIK